MGRGDREMNRGATAAVVVLLSLLPVVVVSIVAAAAANKRPGDAPCRATPPAQPTDKMSAWAGAVWAGDSVGVCGNAKGCVRRS